MVEPSRRSPGHRPLTPHRPDAHRQRLSLDHTRHRRRKNLGPPTAQSPNHRRCPRRRRLRSQPYEVRLGIPLLRRLTRGPASLTRRFGYSDRCAACALFFSAILFALVFGLALLDYEQSLHPAVKILFVAADISDHTNQELRIDMTQRDFLF